MIGQTTRGRRRSLTLNMRAFRSGRAGDPPRMTGSTATAGGQAQPGRRDQRGAPAKGGGKYTPPAPDR